ncbi:MAG: hydroxyacid dehydrogenase [Chitinispirillaceae bacterium]
MKIISFDMEQWERGAFENITGHEVIIEDDKLTPQRAAQYSDADIISVFVYSRIDEEVLSQFKNLKMIATRSTGANHIDLEYCREHDITVCNVPTYGKNTVAEHAFGLILNISHRIYDGIQRTRTGEFTFEGLKGFDLQGKTLGVIGTGDIGAYVIKIAKGMGMEVVAYDVKQREEIRNELGFEYVQFDQLLSSSDIITIHVPGIPQTENMLSFAQFQKMKKGAVLINTSRGTVVNSDALIEALSNGTVSAAGLDVLDEEPVIHEDAELMRAVYLNENREKLKALLADSVLLKQENVYVTPHSAFNTKEAINRILDTTAENINSFVKGQPQNIKG